MSDHPPLKTLRRFADGLLQPDDMATVAIHVAGCESCRKQANREERSSSPYQGAVRRVARRSAKREAQFKRASRRAPSDLARILNLPTEEWNHAVRSSPRYHSYAFAQQALAASKAGWTEDPYRAERLAELGLFVADRLSNAEHGRRNLNDLRSKAWAYIGNCRRIQTNHSTVAEALQSALSLHFAGSAAGRDRIQLISFLRSFVSERFQFAEALELLDEIESLVSHYRDDHAKGRNFWERAVVKVNQREPDQAVFYLQEASRLLRESRERGSTVRIKLTIADALTQTRNPGAASSIYETTTRAELTRLGELDRIRYCWSRARMHWRLGDPSRAAETLEALRDSLSDRRIGSDVAWMSLDLARIHLDLGNAEVASAAAFSAFPVFALRGPSQLTLQALDLFRQAGGLS